MLTGVVRGYGLVVLAALLWGSSGLFARLIYGLGVSPTVVALWRTAFGSCLTLLWTRWLGGRTGRPSGGAGRAPPAGAARLLVASGLAMGLLALTYLHSMGLNRLAVAALLLYTAPAFVAVGAWRWLGEPLTFSKLAALGGALTGVGLLALPGLAPAGLSGAGLAVGLLAGLSYAGLSLVTRAAVRHYPPATTALWTQAVATLTVGLALFPAARGALALPARAWLLLVGAAICNAFLPYLLYSTALTRVPASNASLVALVEPVSSALWGLWWFGERLTPAEVAGATLILGAAALVATQGRAGRVSAASPPPPPPRPESASRSRS